MPASPSTSQGRLGLHHAYRATPWATGATRLRALQVAQLMIAMTSMAEPAQPRSHGYSLIRPNARLAPFPQRREGRPSTGRWTPQERRARPARRPAHGRGTLTPRAPLRAHLRRRPTSHAVWSCRRARCASRRSSSSSRSQRQPRRGRSPLSSAARRMRPIVRSRGANESPGVRAAPGHDAGGTPVKHPPSTRRPQCD